jgi:YD repeat-containing protein
MFIRGCRPDGCDLEPQERNHWTCTRYHRDGRTTEIQYHYPGGRESTSSFTYDEAGRLLEMDTRDAAGAISKSIYSYDGSGRPLRVVVRTADGTERTVRSFSYDDQHKTKTEYLPSSPGEGGLDVMYSMEGSDAAVPAPGATSMTTVYDGQGRPVETVFHDSQQRALCWLKLGYDEAGRMTEETLYAESEETLPAEMLAQLNPAQLQSVKAVFGLGGGRERCKRVHRYDEEGRRIETVEFLGGRSFERRTMAYNQHGDLSEQGVFRTFKELSIDDQGRIVKGGEPSTNETPASEVHFTYQYDEHGNWIERLVASRSQPDQPFVECSLERRSLTYHPA